MAGWRVREMIMQFLSKNGRAGVVPARHRARSLGSRSPAQTQSQSIIIINSTQLVLLACACTFGICTMASSEIIVIDDSSDDEAPRPTAAAARSTAAAAGGGASSKRARVDPTSTTTPADVPAIITPSFAGASTAASANNAHSTASAACAASSQSSPLTGSGVATTSAKKRPSPSLGHEARLLDPALQRADGHGGGTSKSSQEETVEISDPRHTIVDILGNCHAKVSFGAGRGPMPPNAIMGLPGLSVHGVGPVSMNDAWEYYNIAALS